MLDFYCWLLWELLSEFKFLDCVYCLYRLSLGGRALLCCIRMGSLLWKLSKLRV